MSAVSPLQKAYVELSDTVNSINKEIKFENLKTVAKTCAVYLATFAFGYLNAAVFCSLLGITTGILVSIPLVVTGGQAIFSVFTKKIKEQQKHFLIKMFNLFQEKTQSFEKAFTIDNLGILSFKEGWFPNTIQKLQIESFEKVKLNYEIMKSKEPKGFFPWFRAA